MTRSNNASRDLDRYLRRFFSLADAAAHDEHPTLRPPDSATVGAVSHLAVVLLLDTVAVELFSFLLFANQRCLKHSLAVSLALQKEKVVLISTELETNCLCTSKI